MSDNAEQVNEETETRRDFIHLLATATTLGGVGVLAYPVLNSWFPDASVRALATVEYDLAGLEEGQAIKINWQGKPIFIRHRTPEEIERANDVNMSQLIDKSSRNMADEATDAADVNRVVNPKYLVMVGICTHLGCIPLGTAEGEVKGEYDGWFCPCHGSHYDISGRIRKGPAPENLPVPPYEFITDTTIKIG